MVRHLQPHYHFVQTISNTYVEKGLQKLMYAVAKLAMKCAVSGSGTVS